MFFWEKNLNVKGLRMSSEKKCFCINIKTGTSLYKNSHLFGALASYFNSNGMACMCWLT